MVKQIIKIVCVYNEFVSKYKYTEDYTSNCGHKYCTCRREWWEKFGKISYRNFIKKNKISKEKHVVVIYNLPDLGIKYDLYRGDEIVDFASIYCFEPVIFTDIMVIASLNRKKIIIPPTIKTLIIDDQIMEGVKLNICEYKHLTTIISEINWVKAVGPLPIGLKNYILSFDAVDEDDYTYGEDDYTYGDYEKKHEPVEASDVSDKGDVIDKEEDDVSDNGDDHIDLTVYKKQQYNFKVPFGCVVLDLFYHF